MNLFSDLLGIVERIPAAFWGVVIGAFFSLGGVALTNRANDRRLRAQLANDRDLRDRDRELSLRKDIYLSAVEAVFAGVSAVGRFGNLDTGFDNLLDEYAGKSSSIGKALMIAREDTARAIATLTGEITASCASLSIKRIPLIAQKDRLAPLAEILAGLDRERDRLVDLMRQCNLEDEAGWRRSDVIAKDLRFHDERSAGMRQRHFNLTISVNLGRIEFAKECLREVWRLNRLELPVLVAVRRELELPTDEVGYRKAIEDTIAMQEAQMSKAFLDVERLLAGLLLDASGEAPRTARP